MTTKSVRDDDVVVVDKTEVTQETIAVKSDDENDSMKNKLSTNIINTKQIESSRLNKSNGKGSNEMPVMDRMDQSDYITSGDMNVIANWNGTTSGESEQYRVTLKTTNTVKDIENRDTVKISNRAIDSSRSSNTTPSQRRRDYCKSNCTCVVL